MEIQTCRRAAWCASILFSVNAARAQDDCTDEVALGFSADWIQSDVAFEGILGGETAAGELRVVGGQGEPGRVEVFANIVSRIAADQPGVQGWSLGIAVDGAASIASATVEGTPPICPLLACERHLQIVADRKGIVTVVYLPLVTKGVVFPPVGTHSVLAIRLETDEVQGEEDQVASLAFRDGLSSSEGPIDNVILRGGDTVKPCNLPSASLSLTFSSFHSEPQFIRGNANGDSRVDVADPVWLLNELFRGGPATTCREAADANDDGQVNITDPVHVLGFQFRGSEPPPPPYPLCAPDVDGDGVSCLEMQPGCE
jgi:hypothetical protein